MIIPRKIRIGGHLYNVEVVPSWDGFEQGDCGQTFYEKGLICINSNLIESEKWSTLIHEAMHVMNKTLNHELLDSLSEQIYQFLAANDLLE